jgi:hypothetical protein
MAAAAHERGANLQKSVASARSDRRSERPVLGSLQGRLLANASGSQRSEDQKIRLSDRTTSLVRRISPTKPNASPLHDVKHPQARTASSRIQKTSDTRPDPPISDPPISDLLISDLWWSQTGSNRRPPACKAGALPAELWPREIASSVIRWWARDDSNVRPHPYQGCALTT